MLRKRKYNTFDSGGLSYRERRNLQHKNEGHYYLNGSKSKPKPDPTTQVRRCNRGRNIARTLKLMRNAIQVAVADQNNQNNNQQNNNANQIILQPQQMHHQPQINNLNSILSAIPLVEEPEPAAAVLPPQPQPQPIVVHRPLQKGMTEARRNAILFFYVQVYDRIVQDIQHLPEVIDKLIQARGCVVQDVALRHGRRDWPKLKGLGLCKYAPKLRQRKETLKEAPIHPDCIEARNTICNVNAPAVQMVVADILQQQEADLDDESDGEGEDNDVVQHVDAPDNDIFANEQD